MSGPPRGGDVQHQIQRALASVMVEGFGRPPGEVAEMLSRALAAVGAPEQPAPWMRTAASEVAVGRILIVNTREIPEHLEHAAPDPSTHAAG